MITVVGCGPGHREGFTVEALRVVRSADVLVGARRLLDLFPRHRGERIHAARSAHALSILAERMDRNCAVLVSGDPGLASLGRAVREHFGAGVKVVPGVSSAVAACAMAGWDWESARFLSLHAIESSLAASPDLSGTDMVVVLGGRAESSRRMAQWLRADGGQWEIVVARDAGFPQASLVEVESDRLESFDATGRTVVLARRRER